MRKAARTRVTSAVELLPVPMAAALSDVDLRGGLPPKTPRATEAERGRRASDCAGADVTFWPKASHAE